MRFNKKGQAEIVLFLIIIGIVALFLYNYTNYGGGLPIPCACPDYYDSSCNPLDERWEQWGFEFTGECGCLLKRDFKCPATCDMSMVSCVSELMPCIGTFKPPTKIWGATCPNEHYEIDGTCDEEPVCKYPPNSFSHGWYCGNNVMQYVGDCSQCKLYSSGSSACPTEYDPVCSYSRGNYRTYSNVCVACTSEDEITGYLQGRCEEIYRCNEPIPMDEGTCIQKGGQWVIAPCMPKPVLYCSEVRQFAD